MRPTADELSAATALLSVRLRTGWRRLDGDSADAASYKMACAIVADQSDYIEAPPRAWNQLKEPMPQLRIRDAVRRALLTPGGPSAPEVWGCPLAFYSSRWLIEFRIPAAEGAASIRFVCAAPSAWRDGSLISIPILGDSAPIHRINAYEWRSAGDPKGFLDVDRTDGLIEDYLRFFCNHVAAADGYFHVVERANDFLKREVPVTPVPEATEIYRDGEGSFVWMLADKAADEAATPGADVTFEDMASRIVPLTRIVRSGETFFVGTIVHAGVLTTAIFKVKTDGLIEMSSDHQHFDGKPLPVIAVRDSRRTSEALNALATEIT